LKASVVILNYNGASHLREFLPSVIEHNPSWAEIVVADNGSTDDSLKVLSEEFPTVRAISLNQNHGFAGGYNKALEQIDSEYYAILNSDCMVTKGWLETLVGLLDKKKDVWAVQPKLKDYQKRQYFEYAGASGGFMDKHGYPFCRGRIFDKCEKDIGQHDEMREVFWATGACIVVRADKFRESGGFDENLFAHMEEIDLCWRMKNRGGKIYCDPSATVYHLGGGTLSAQNSFKTYLNFRNNLRIIIKNDYRDALPIRIFKRLILDGAAALYFIPTRGFSHFLAVIKAHFHFYFHLGQILKLRKEMRQYSETPNRTGLYKRSVVKAYYLEKKKVFGALSSINFVRQASRIE
jgi:GT2 family glycosyltransferase